MTNTTISWDQLEKEMSVLSLPVKEYKYNAYKNGECTQFDTGKEAYACSKLTEKVQYNKENYDALYKAYAEQQQLIYNTWMNNIREYFNNYSPAEIEIMYSYGYDKGHSCGYDEVFNHMEDFSNYIDQLKIIWYNAK